MGKIKVCGKLCKNQIRSEVCSMRVWMGYLIGIMFVLGKSVPYLRYAHDSGNPVNLLDCYMILGNDENSIIFLVLGLLLILSDAPFMSNLSFYAIYRTNKGIWNQAMICYVVVQSFIYYLVLAVVSIVISIPQGYAANIWSVPMQRLSEEGGSLIGIRYGIQFSYQEAMHLQKACWMFLHTVFDNMLYGIMLGLVLYAMNIVVRRTIGIIGTMIIHVVGFIAMREGMGFTIRLSLLARSMPAKQVGEGVEVSLFSTYLIFLCIIAGIIFLSNQLLKKGEMRITIRQEGD